MDGNERISKFLILQEKNLKFADISIELGISQSTLRTFLNKRGYKSIKGKYVLKSDLNNKVNDKFDSKKDNILKDNIEQLDFTDVTSTSQKRKSTTKNTNSKESVSKKKNVKKADKETAIQSKEKESINISTSTKRDTNKQSAKKQTSKIDNIEKKNTTKKTKAKVDKKINITQEDLDKLCEVYDWYLQVKDYANDNLNKIKKSEEKDVFIEKEKIEEVKSTTIRIDKSIWNEFERLCSNSKYNKSIIITQALKDFMKEYKDLL